MKKLYLFIFLMSSITIFSQSILKGKILGKDNIPLEGVNIYFDGTTFATISDAKGNYSIAYEANSNSVLVISFMGYEREYLTSLDVSKPLNIKMTLSKNQLKEVVVSQKELFTRAQKLKIFREYFLGKTNNAKSSVINNEDDIQFKYDKKKLILTASSNKPLVIVNSSLGYKINYELVGFEIVFDKISMNSKDVINNFYQGVSRFEEVNNSAENLERREKAFEGSQVQFFRNLANKDWGSDKFLLFNESDSIDPDVRFGIIKEDDLVKVKILPQRKGEMKNEENIKDIVASYNVMFKNKEASKIVFLTDSFYVYKYGNNSNINNILFLGGIAEKKVGDLLPLNYGM
ncbi:carboxypeptidase-like regulatory domain-containing protein [Flavobacterium piscisymbiosum]|uniref:Carboxypeptidase-like regulatory domain-containing protein n=1 Tax=Flavobacterium piscisymbiosum TaxID=2893753 RepID=A0ABS8MHW8_9FLAO|nr:carboxypeptidase-like regulatory domain-containing protein [Flavobacterium sp. F-30]MCC9065079.1 carboxypeptidase-like regulatory domain-containing protein [Flavobacterium sp. F-30]